MALFLYRVLAMVTQQCFSNGFTIEKKQAPNKEVPSTYGENITYRLSMFYFQMKWELIEPMSVSRAGAGVASVNGILYVMGGRTASSTEACTITAPPATLASVECYDTAAEVWFEIGEMPTSRCEAAVVVL